MKFFVLIILFIFINFLQANAAKILFASCSPAPSHQKPFQAIWEALALRGHEVHVLTPIPLNNASIVNLIEYNLSDLFNEIKSMVGKDYQFLVKKPNFFNVFSKDVVATRLWSEMYAYCLNHSETKRLLKNNKHFDVVIVEYIFPTLTSFGAYFQAPLIGISSLGVPTVALDTVGNPTHPIIAPDMNLPITRDMNFRERLLAGLYAVYVRIYYHLVVLPRENLNVQKYISKDLPYIGEMEKNTSLLLLNRNPVFHRLMPFVPAVIELGKIQFPKNNKKLDLEIQQFIESSSNGTIYFSLGTGVKSFALSKNVIEIFRSVFASLSYNVIWKWDNETMENKPENILIKKWISQTAVLNHPNVKLFITQGGLQSLEETIEAETPIIGIPFHSDQTYNVDTCVKYGVGKMLNLEDITEERLKEFILEIIDNPKYKANIKNLNQLLGDYPQDGIEKAMWWIEYVIRHKGAKYLRSNLAIELPWWQYLLLDIYGFIAAIVLLILFIIYCIVKLIIKLVLCLKKSILKKEKNKND